MVHTFLKKGDTIQGGTSFKGGHYLRKYGIYSVISLYLSQKLTYHTEERDFRLLVGLNIRFEEVKSLENSKTTKILL